MNSGPAAAEALSRDDRLRKRREFEECYASGVRASGRFIQVFLSTDEAPAPGRCRLGISVPRRVGNAVARNRVRRRLREIFRRERAALPLSARALVVHARPSAAPAPFSEIRADYLDTVARASRQRPRSTEASQRPRSTGASQMPRGPVPSRKPSPPQKSRR